MTTFSYGRNLEIRAVVSGPVDWLRIYYRNPEHGDYQVRNMDREGETDFVIQLDTSQLAGIELEYYFQAVRGDVSIVFPESAPEQLLRVTGERTEMALEIPEDLPSAQEEGKRLRVKLPMNVSGSIQSTLYDPNADPEAKKTNAAGNIRVFTTYNKNDFGVDFDSNFAYTNMPYEGEKNIDLTNMSLSLSKGNHRLTAGDVNINESEFTVSGLGRRGFEYSFDNRKASVHLFDISTQEPKGFNGFGIPKINISLFGGSVGFKLFNESLSLKAVYLSGKDDPGEGVNVGFDSFTSAREGNVISLVEDLNLFENSLNVSSEYSQSEYDEDINDAIDAIKDNAWRVSGNLSLGFLTLGSGYRHVGKRFNPIGFQYFTNNRAESSGTIGLNLGKVSISGMVGSSHDNVENDPDDYTNRNININSSLMWTVSDKVSVNFGYTRDKQNTTGPSEFSAFLQDTLSNQIMGSLNMMLGQAANISFSLMNSSMSSEQNPMSGNSNLTINFGGSFRAGQVLSIMPTIGYSEMLSKYSDEVSRTFNTFLSSELNIIQRILSLSFSGAYTRSEMGPDNASDSMNVSGNLNLSLQELIKLGNINLSLRGNYNWSKMMDFTQSFRTLVLQTDFSF